MSIKICDFLKYIFELIYVRPLTSISKMSSLSSWQKKISIITIKFKNSNYSFAESMVSVLCITLLDAVMSVNIPLRH